MKQIKIKSYAKLNLALNITGLLALALSYIAQIVHVLKNLDLRN